MQLVIWETQLQLQFKQDCVNIKAVIVFTSINSVSGDKLIWSKLHLMLDKNKHTNEYIKYWQEIKK